MRIKDSGNNKWQRSTGKLILDRQIINNKSLMAGKRALTHKLN